MRRSVRTRFGIATALGILAMLQASIAPARNPMNYGHFGELIQVEWLRGDSSERRMKLLRELRYTDPSGKVWVVPVGYVTDGASIPRVFWTLVGAPFEGAYREGALVHDYLCDTKDQPYQDVHRLFYYANRAAGVSEIQAKILYAGVLMGGPKWAGGRSKCFAACHALPSTYSEDAGGHITFQPSVAEQDAQKVAAWVKGAETGSRCDRRLCRSELSGESFRPSIKVLSAEGSRRLAAHLSCPGLRVLIPDRWGLV